MMKKTIITISSLGLILGGGTLATDAALSPYKESRSAFVIQKDSTLNEGRSNKISVLKDETKVIFEKWDGEVSMGLSYQGIKSKAKRQFLSKNIVWKDDQQVMEAVPIDPQLKIEDGGLEINIYLKSKPQSNIFKFQLDDFSNLNLFYQPPLWQFARLITPNENCTETDCKLPYGMMHEDENIVGSYIAYSKTKKDHVVGKTNYGNGQLFTIYRPEIIDNTGRRVWGNLSYEKEKGILSVEVPDDFLEYAQYPVKIDPVIGYTTHSGNSTTWSADQTVATANSVQSASVTGPVSMISFYGNSSGATGNFKAYMTDTSNVILGSISSAKAITNTTQQWDAIYSGPTLTNGTSYKAWVIFDSTTSTDGTIGACTVNFKTTSYASPTNPTTPSSTTNCFTIFATYSASGGSTPSSITSDLIQFE